MRKNKKTVLETIGQHIEERSKRNTEFRKAYLEELTSLNLAYKITQLRKARHLTQKQLAKRMKTSQQTISRLEDPQNAEVTLTTLSKLAVALRARLSVDIIPQDYKIA